MSDTLCFDTDTIFENLYYHSFLAKLSPMLNTNSTSPIATQQGVEVYPNPNNGSFTIYDLPPDQSGGIYDFKIQDDTGRTVYSKTINSQGIETINTSLTDGIYFWEITSSDGIQAKGKIAVMK